MPPTSAGSSSNSWGRPTGSTPSGPARALARYAWMTLHHSRWRSVDDSGMVRRRVRGPRPTTVAIDSVEPANRAPGPGEGIEERESIAAITKAVGQLPPSLRKPLLESIQGHPSGGSPKTSDSQRAPVVGASARRATTSPKPSKPKRLAHGSRQRRLSIRCCNAPSGCSTRRSRRRQALTRTRVRVGDHQALTRTRVRVGDHSTQGQRADSRILTQSRLIAARSGRLADQRAAPTPALAANVLRLPEAQ